MVLNAETRTEACEPILGVKTHCKVLIIYLK